MEKLTEQQAALMERFGDMVECVVNLSPEERAEFDQWDANRPDGVRTSDWPGFAKYISKS